MQAKSTVGPALLGYNLFTHIRIFNKHLPFHTKIIIMNINILIMSAVITINTRDEKLRHLF